MRILTIIATLAITLSTSGESLAQARTWISSTGSEIEAEFISITGGEPGSIEKVTLKTAEGKILTVRTSQLSDADRKWLADKKPKAAPAPAPTPTSPSSPAPNSSAPAAGEPSDSELERLSEILDKALKENPPEAERDEAAAIFARLLPTKDVDGKALRWDVSLPPSADPGNNTDTSVLISVDLFPADAEDDDRDARLVWMHVVYHDKTPESYGFNNDKIGRYPVMRAEDRHAFVLVGRTEVRAIADDESYESDAALGALVESMNLDAIKGL